MLVLYCVTSRAYAYTYHGGYFLAAAVFFDSLLTYYSLYYVVTRYEGEYVPVAPLSPLVLVIVAIILNQAVLSLVFGVVVLRGIYCIDARYAEWRANHKVYWWIFVVGLMPALGGHRLHKLNYSKLFGWQVFSFRIVSVSKFYWEDVLTLISLLGDVLFVAAMAACIYNIFITYSGLLVLGYECLALKGVLWVLVFYDLKKPDRGFFKGD